MGNRRFAAILGVTIGLLALVPASVPAAVPEGATVKVSGTVYRFGPGNALFVNALVRVREYPGIWALSDQKGDYELTVPDDANVTPYIVSGWHGGYSRYGDPPLDPATRHYNGIDLQTFHTRGENIVNANFQTPTDFEFNMLKALLKVKSDAAGRPKQCVIVTTASARNVRGVDFSTFRERTPHGVSGATSRALPGGLLPTYFNASVLPDPNQPATSGDGGIIWAVVPTGTYRVVTESPTARFASFLATCASGRVVNANPPWGAYELAPGEAPLAASNVAASLKGAKAARKGEKRIVTARFEAGEAISARIRVTAGRQTRGTISGQRRVKLAPAGQTRTASGERSVEVPLKASARPGRATVTAVLTDASGVSFTYTARVTVPKPAGKQRRPR